MQIKLTKCQNYQFAFIPVVVNDSGYELGLSLWHLDIISRWCWQHFGRKRLRWNTDSFGKYVFETEADYLLFYLNWNGKFVEEMR